MAGKHSGGGQTVGGGAIQGLSTGSSLLSTPAEIGDVHDQSLKIAPAGYMLPDFDAITFRPAHGIDPAGLVGRCRGPDRY